MEATDYLRDSFCSSKTVSTIPINVLNSESVNSWAAKCSQRTQTWVDASRFEAIPGQISFLTSASGSIERVLFGISGDTLLLDIAALRAQLPSGKYHLSSELSHVDDTTVALGWAFGGYAYTCYKTGPSCCNARKATLAWPEQTDKDLIAQFVTGTFLARDLINTPAIDLGPQELSQAAQAVAKAHNAEFSEVVGEDLLVENYPLIHAVGRASTRQPRLIDIRWGCVRDPKVTLVGKGVCFDTGGLNLKNATSMYDMKSDMGGAAQALGLATMIMMAQLKIRLRVLIPAVENSIAGDSYRPSDVVQSRAGLSVEIGNTDAEGRLLLADALAEADSESPELLIDMATLTGSVKETLGDQIAGFFTLDEQLATSMMRIGVKGGDPVWHLPLFEPYRKGLMSNIADIKSTGKSRFGRGITAALFLETFVKRSTSWVHFDFMAWNSEDRPGQPAGGEVRGLRTLFLVLKERYGST